MLSLTLLLHSKGLNHSSVSSNTNFHNGMGYHMLQSSNQVYRPGPNICYFENIHWYLPLSYRNQRNQRSQSGISDVQICWSHGWLAHTALREVFIVLPSCSPDVPKPQSPNPRTVFFFFLTTYQQKLAVKILTSHNPWLNFKGSSIRRCKGLSLVHEEKSPVMHQTTGMAKQSSILTKDTALFSRPSRGRNG